jgi:ribose transport system permease protein
MQQQATDTNTDPGASGPATRAPSGGRLLARMKRSSCFFPLVGLIAVCLVMIATTDNFFSLSNFLNIARQVSINAIIAVGMSCAILSGGIDLCVGAVMALSGTLMAGMMVAGVPPFAAILLGLGVGLLFGLFNGFFVAYAGMPPIIVTLATMGIARGLALIYTGGYPIDGLPEMFAFFGRGAVFGVQTPVVIMLLVFVLAYLLLDHTPVGRYIYAIGSNEEAARLSGVRVARYKLLVYALSGFTCALAGLVLSSRLMSGQPNAGVAFEMDAIAAVVMGGTSISGGRGSIIGTLIGALMLGVLNNGLNMMGVSPYVQNIIKGLIILFAIYISRERRKRR